LRFPLYAPLLAAAPGPEGCFVLGRIAQTLDGRIATANGASFWISGPEDILHTHRLRALSDAIVVGAGTVQADDPLLTTRKCAGPSPVRVIVDTERRLTAARRVFHGGPQTLVMVADDRPGPAELGQAEIVPVPRVPGGLLDLSRMLSVLAQRGLTRVFVEGGGITVSRFLAAGLLDRLHVTMAPLLLGCGIPAFTLPGCDRPQDGLRLSWDLHRLGDDVLFDIPLGRAKPPSCR
jgi:diaminohydroxyphosphoribosylaminopyrimidine deaminase / 5-amino-6-(5-phosphoribosylamino)uracil reductase